MPNIIFEIIFAFILFLPAYIANPAAVIFGGYFPMDFGKTFFGKGRIFGKGKTWSGFIGGSLSGAALGYLMMIIFIATGWMGGYPYGSTIIAASITIFSMSVGSLVGDATGSFLKRRMGLKSGTNAFLLDQWPFVLVAFLFLFIFSREFFMQYYGNVIGTLTILLVTPPLHRAVNIIGFKTKRKNVPW